MPRRRVFLAAVALVGAAVAAAPAARAAALGPAAAKRALPSPLNAAYVGGPCDPPSIVLSCEQGINTLFWFSISLTTNATTGRTDVLGGPDLACVATVAAALAARNLPTTHMITVGGWDAPHPSTGLPAEEVYGAWAAWNENVVAAAGLPNGFDGIDWDLEGFDDVSNPDNAISVPCVDLVGRFSQLAQAAGYVVTMVPPESYLDPVTSPAFDLSLLHDYPNQPQHANFTYHGRSAYAPLLAKYGTVDAGAPRGIVPTFDAVMIQLYESFSHAVYNISTLGQGAADYLAAWAPRVVDGFPLDFSAVPGLDLPSGRVAVPAPALVLGLANGWAGGDRALLIAPADVCDALGRLAAAGYPLRGTVFWTITNEGTVPAGGKAPLYYAAGMNECLKTRGRGGGEGGGR